MPGTLALLSEGTRTKKKKKITVSCIKIFLGHGGK